MSETLSNFADDVVASVRGYLARNLAPVLSRLKALEDRPAPVALKGDPGDPGKDGKDADMDALFAHTRTLVEVIAKPGKDGIDGKNVDMAELIDSTAKEIRRLVDAIPRAVDGNDGANGKDANPVDMQEVQRIIQAEVARAVATLPKPADGEQGIRGEKGADAVVDMEAIVSAAVARIPVPKDGKDGIGIKGESGSNGKDADPMVVKALVDQAVAEIPRPKDGAPGKDADIELVKSIVQIAVDAVPKPKDGENGKDATVDVEAIAKSAAALIPAPRDGRDGVDADPREVATVVRAEVQRVVAAMPKPADGEKGADGKDGFSPDDFEAEFKDDSRTLVLKFATGNHVVTRELKVAGMVMERGVYQSGRTYEKGDGVTYGGSFWIAKQDTSEPPKGDGNHWRLAVKGSK